MSWRTYLTYRSPAAPCSHIGIHRNTGQAAKPANLLALPLAPHLGGSRHDQLKLRLLLVRRQRVPGLGRSEAALPRQAQLVERHVLGGLVDPPLKVVLGL